MFLSRHSTITTSYARGSEPEPDSHTFAHRHSCELAGTRKAATTSSTATTVSATGTRSRSNPSNSHTLQSSSSEASSHWALRFCAVVDDAIGSVDDDAIDDDAIGVGDDGASDSLARSSGGTQFANCSLGSL